MPCTNTNQQSAAAQLENELSDLMICEEWRSLPFYEQEKRSTVVAAIVERVHKEGFPQPEDDPMRPSLFMPFAALKGYDHMVEQVTQDTIMPEHTRQ